MKKKSKSQRQKELIDLLKNDPFYTDEELSSLFEVSIQTIRLDRMSLNIPELRERLKKIAENQSSKVKTLGKEDIFGEILELSVGNIGISMLEITDDMIYSNTGNIKEPIVFSMIFSLAMAVVDARRIKLKSANTKIFDSVKKNERLIAKAEVEKEKVFGIEKEHIVKVTVNSRNNKKILEGVFTFEELI
ncbi:MAG: transcription factor FapR [Clostridioides sp.]|jgi:hypothetical protein|nr:transcription factor FapR [Clostridioides sp.]